MSSRLLFLLAQYGILHHSSQSPQSPDTSTLHTSNFLLFSSQGGSLESTGCFNNTTPWELRQTSFLLPDSPTFLEKQIKRLCSLPFYNQQEFLTLNIHHLWKQNVMATTTKHLCHIWLRIPSSCFFSFSLLLSSFLQLLHSLIFSRVFSLPIILLFLELMMLSVSLYPDFLRQDSI